MCLALYVELKHFHNLNRGYKAWQDLLLKQICLRTILYCFLFSHVVSLVLFMAIIQCVSPHVSPSLC